MCMYSLPNGSTPVSVLSEICTKEYVIVNALCTEPLSLVFHIGQTHNLRTLPYEQVVSTSIYTTTYHTQTIFQNI
jgi:hypothetical protein